MITGIPVVNQRLALYESDEDKQPVIVLDDDAKTLGYYSPRDFQVLRVTFPLVDIWPCLNYVRQVEDTNPSTTFTGQLTDFSGVEKFELSEEQYAQRQGRRTAILHLPMVDIK